MKDPVWSNPDDALEAERAGPGNAAYHRKLSIAVLGPSVASGSGNYGLKRNQIRDSLQEAGHDAFYPETRIDINAPWVLGESSLLESKEVDLIVLFQTPSSFGVVAEIGAFSVIPKIRRKTIVLTPEQHYTPDEGFLANTINLYPIRIPYTEQQFEKCYLLDDCKQAVDEFLVIQSDLIQNFEF